LDAQETPSVQFEAEVRENAPGIAPHLKAVLQLSGRSGAVWYGGTEMGDDLALAVIQALEKECGLSSAGTADKGVEITVRRKEKSSWLFVLNHTDESRSVDIPKGWHLLQGTEGPVLPPFGFRIYSKEK